MLEGLTKHVKIEDSGTSKSKAETATSERNDGSPPLKKVRTEGLTLEEYEASLDDSALLLEDFDLTTGSNI